MTDQEIMEKNHNIGYTMLGWLDELCRKYNIQYWVGYGTLLGAIRHQGFIPWDDDIDIWMTRENYQKLKQHWKEIPDDCEVMLRSSYGANRYYDLVTHISYKYMYNALCSDAYEFYNHTFPSGMHIDIFFLDKTYNDWRGKMQILKTTVLYGLMNSYRHKSIRIDDYPLIWKVFQAILSFVGRHISLERMFKWADKVAMRYNDCEDADYYFCSNGGLHVGDLFSIKAFQEINRVPFGPLMVDGPDDFDYVLKILYGKYLELPSKEDQKLPVEGMVFLPTENERVPKHLMEETQTISQENI